MQILAYVSHTVEGFIIIMAACSHQSGIIQFLKDRDQGALEIIVNFEKRLSTSRASTFANFRPEEMCDALLGLANVAVDNRFYEDALRIFEKASSQVRGVVRADLSYSPPRAPPRRYEQYAQLLEYARDTAVRYSQHELHPVPHCAHVPAAGSRGQLLRINTFMPSSLATFLPFLLSFPLASRMLANGKNAAFELRRGRRRRWVNWSPRSRSAATQASPLPERRCGVWT